MSPTPGIAKQRIDGFDKVTGAKVYARDFSARDMGGDWPEQQYYAMYLRALTTQQVFLGLNNYALPEAAQNARIILGNELSPSQRSPQLSTNRDSLVDDQAKAIYEIEPSPEGFDRPRAVVFDLIVQPGNVPDYLGQAVALLIFEDLASYRAAKTAMEFQDSSFQTYGNPTKPLPPRGQVFDPKTTYVKYDVGGETFDYASANSYSYPYEVDAYRDRITKRLADMPGLQRYDFTSDMRAMDPMFMEPEAGLAWLHESKKKLHLVLGTQSPDGDVSDILSMYSEDDSPAKIKTVELTSCYPGGGFGGRDKSPFSLMLGLAAAYTDGQPVKLVYDRFEQFRVGLKRHAATLEGQIAVGSDMKLQNVEMTLNFDGGGRKNLSPYVASLAALCAGGSYKTPMANIYAQAVHSENISGGSQRGFGGPQAFFAIETALDEIALRQGWNPVELRRVNAIEEGDTTVVGGPVNQQLRLHDMLDRAEKHDLWANRADIKQDYESRGLTYGTGFAMSLQAYGTSGDGVISAVLIDENGKITVQSDAVDMGNGSATTLGVVIGDILGANASQVDMGCYTLFGQTGLTTSDPQNQRWANPNWTAKSVGSSSACLTGLHQVHVVQQTARALFESSLLPAARLIWDQPEITADQTFWADSKLHLRDGGADPLPLPDLAAVAFDLGLPRGTLGHAYFQDIWARADYDIGAGPTNLALDGLSVYMPGETKAQQIQRQNTVGPQESSRAYARYIWAPCVNVIGLTVDHRTGRVQIENVVSVLNAGKIHVEPLVSGQSQGGVAMAVSYTLHEDMPPGMTGPANGTWNLNRYHVARSQDVPLSSTYRRGGRAQELIVMEETPEDEAQGRGIAEAVMCSIAPAISNGIRDAIGKRFTSLPITPAKILEGLN